MSNWRLEEQRKRDAAEVERLRIEREKQRLEEEALRKAKEAEERAGRERLRLEAEAEELRQRAAKAQDAAEMKRIEEQREKIRLQAEENRKQAEETTNRAIDEAAKAEAAMTPAPVVPEAPKTAGLSMRNVPCFEIEDPMIIPREYLAVDEVKVGKVVRATNGQITIPGVRIFFKPIMVAISSRGK